jgi:hypothetical protein
MEGEQNAPEPKTVEGQVPPPLSARDARWKFIRDVAVFEFKLAINNVHNFLQIPVSFAIAVFDLLFTAKEKEEGSRFYKFVEWGRTIDDHIDIYSVVDHRERSMNRDFTIDALVGKLEAVRPVEIHGRGGQEHFAGKFARLADGALGNGLEHLRQRPDQPDIAGRGDRYLKVGAVPRGVADLPRFDVAMQRRAFARGHEFIDRCRRVSR